MAAEESPLLVGLRVPILTDGLVRVLQSAHQFTAGNYICSAACSARADYGLVWKTSFTWFKYLRRKL